ncbi:MAG TPA: P-loop NTPase [Rhabdochlamydiaceae bacterium]|nr:P-loop NTPase [Rhabdochlamydiaceae bacterium]
MGLKIISNSNQPTSFKIKNIVAIAAGKGGVGKSTVAVNLALAFMQQGYRVGLLDADVYGPSILQMLPKGIWPVQDPGDPERILPGLTLGLKMISTAHFRNEQEGAIVRAPIANSIITQFLQQVNWGDLDYLIIDFPPGTGDIQLTLMQQATISGAVMVTTPQEVALIDVRKSMQMFQKLQVPLLGVIENMSFFIHPATEEKHFPFGSGGGKKLADEFEIPYLGQIPIDGFLSRCGDLGESIFSTPNSTAALLFDGFAKKIGEALSSTDKEAVKGIQRGDDSFTLQWSDGATSSYLYKELQKHCPCAACQDRSRSNTAVSAVDISRVGHYGLKIVFTSGCSKGIFTLSFLRKWANL